MTNRRRAIPLLVGITALSTVSCSSPPQPAELHLAAAANLRAVLDPLNSAFQAKTHVHVVPTIGSTAQLAQQIENGAPIDVFLSADSEHVDQLIHKGIAEASSRATYARGQLVLWAPSRPDISGLKDLGKPGVKSVGCARPELAPYGKAAIESLKAQGLWTVVEPKLVYAQSISASKQFADSGNVGASFTALSLVFNQSGHYVVIDESLHAPIEQALCIVKQTTQPAAARQFRDFILSAEAVKILRDSGYR